MLSLRDLQFSRGRFRSRLIQWNFPTDFQFFPEFLTKHAVLFIGHFQEWSFISITAILFLVFYRQVQPSLVKFFLSFLSFFFFFLLYSPKKQSIPSYILNSSPNQKQWSYTIAVATCTYPNLIYYKCAPDNTLRSDGNCTLYLRMFSRFFSPCTTWTVWHHRRQWTQTVVRKD